MKIAIDLDGTAWRYPVLFSALATALIGGGHEVGILTGHMDHLRDADLHLWHARGLPKPAFLFNASDAERVGIVHGRPQREWKPELALHHGIALLIDNFDGEAIELCVLDG